MPRKKRKEETSQPAEERQESAPVEEEPEGEPVEEKLEGEPVEERPFQPNEMPVARLREALALLEPAVPRKHSLPVLAMVRLGEGKVMATDLEVAVTVALPEAAHAVLLPHREALDFLRYTPGHEVARITAGNGEVVVTAGDREARFKAPGTPEAFPLLPPPESEHEGVLDGDSLVKALAAVEPYAATEDTRPLLTGVCLTLGDQVEAATADGFRLVWEKVPGRLPGEGTLIIPARAIRLLEYLWKRVAAPDLTGASDPVRVALARRPIGLSWGRDRLQMRFGGVTLMAQLIQGIFPDYRQLIPKEALSSVTVMADDMLRALQQVKRLAKDGSGLVRLQWEGDRLRLSARAEEVGETITSITARPTAPGKVALNISYLLEYFKGKEGSITISTTGDGNGPVMFAYRGISHTLIMPMFVQW